MVDPRAVSSRLAAGHVSWRASSGPVVPGNSRPSPRGRLAIAHGPESIPRAEASLKLALAARGASTKSDRPIAAGPINVQQQGPCQSKFLAHSR